MIWTTQGIQMKDGKHHKHEGLWRRNKAKCVCVLTVAALMVVVVVGATVVYLFFRPQVTVYVPVNFEDKLKEVCVSPRLSPLEYKGVESFFHYLETPDVDHCYSWVEFGGEKIPIPSQSEKECSDEVRKVKYICFNEEYKMTHDPCLVYSFTKDMDNQFERDMQLFSCEVHAFDHEKVSEAEHVQRSEFWMEHAWAISEAPYDKPEKDGSIQRRRSLDYITQALGHNQRELKFLKSDLEGREWILLRQVISNIKLLDIQQIGVRLHLPTTVNQMSGEARHQYFAKMFKVFQGLQCAGYKYVMGRAVKYYKGFIRIPEINNRTFYPAYEVNWAKVL